jgi:hypothetical protein
MQPNTFLRKRFLVNQPYQFRFIAEILLVVIFASLLSTGGAYVLMKGELASEFYTSQRKLDNLNQALPRILAVSSIVTFFAMALLGGFITLRETHRVIGPVGKMEKKFKEMAEGNLSYMVSFRKGDVLKGLDDSINIHLNNLSDLLTTFEKVKHDVIPMLLALEKSEGDTAQNISMIRNLLAELDHYAEAFRGR